MNRFFFAVFALFCTAAFLCGCASDHSQEALQRARDFAMEHTRTIPEIARDHIRYTPPQVQYSTIFRHSAMKPTDYAHLMRTAAKKDNTSKDYMVINFVWQIPDADYSVVVLGTGLRNYSHWEGRRVIMKKTVPVRRAYENARTMAVGYAVNNMLRLTRKEINRVRFSEAAVLQTDFPLEHFKTSFHEKGGPDSWKDYLARLKAGEERYQYSLVWKADSKDHFIVITGEGLAKSADPEQAKVLDSWQVMTGRVISGALLHKYTLRNVDTYTGKSLTSFPNKTGGNSAGSIPAKENKK